MALRPTVFDAYVPAFGEARLGQASVKPNHAVGPLRRRHPMQHPYHGHRRPLRLRGERRGNRSECEPAQERAPVHFKLRTSITSRLNPFPVGERFSGQNSAPHVKRA
jgi:hypothetical protein